MRPSEIAEAVAKANRPLFIWSAPGMGKSSVVAQVARANNWEFYDVRLGLLDPTDLRGIPVPEGDRARWLAPSFLPKKGPAMLFLDELNVAPPLVQASAYQLVLDRKIGEYVLPDGVKIVAAGNRSGDRAVVHRMPSALASRFIHLDFEVDLDDWMSWAMQHEIRPEVVGFLKTKPDLLHAFDPTKEERAFPCPRTWEYVSNTLDTDVSPNVKYAMIEGTVGKGAAAMFSAWERVYGELPNPDDVLSGKYTLVPARIDLKIALATAVAYRAKPNQFEQAIKYAMRLPEEYSVLLVMLLSNKDKKAVGLTPSFPTWAAKHKDMFIS